MGARSLVLMALLLSACGRVEMMETPLPERALPYAFERARTSSFSFEGAVASVRRGEVIFHRPALFPSPSGREVACNDRGRQFRVEWDEGRKELGGWRDETGAVFYEVMSANGLRVAGDPNALFTGQEKKGGARLRVGANVVSLKGNACSGYDGKFFDSRDVYAGELLIGVEWTLYDPIGKKVVKEVHTQGYARVYGIEDANGVQVTFLKAFADASSNLANSKEFVDALTASYRERRGQTDESGGRLSIQGVPRWHDGIAARVASIVPGVVAVRVGEGHGSGVIVSRDGYILTAHHVVEDAETATVRFNNGVELPAKVVRRSVKRDAALLRIEAGGLSPLPVDAKRVLKPSAEVFACGAPLREDLLSTLTRGIVSATRVDSEGMRLVQSDVAVEGGSSGGPLLDGNGNVVGLAVSGMVKNKASTGMNFFAPIDEVLEELQIELTGGEVTD